MAHTYEGLKMEEENLRITLDSIGDGVIATDTDGNVTQINPAAQKLTGWTFESAQGRPLTEVFNIVNAKTKEVVVNPVTKVLELGKTVGLANHTMLIAKDGAEYQIADSAAPIRDTNGNIAGVVLVFRDVTEKYHLQEIVLETNERLQGALEASHAGTWRVDMSTGNDTRDASLNRLLGLPAEPTTQPLSDWFTYVHPDDAEPMKLAWEKGLETGLYSVEHRLIRKDGETLWVYDRGRMIRDADGQLLYAIGAVMDITERKQAEEDLRKSEKLLNTIAENYPNSYVAIIEHDFTVSFLSGQEFKNQQLDPEDFVGLSLDEIYGEDAAIIRSHYEETFNGKGCAFEFFHNNQYHFYRTVPLQSGDGTIQQILVVVENITERKQAENALRRAQKMDAIGQLTGGIAHDFNNILGIIIGNLDLLNLTITDNKAAQGHIDEARKAALRATELTKNLLGFSRRRSDKSAITDMNSVVKGMDSLITHSLTPKVIVESHLAEDLWLCNIDSGDLEDTLLNLIINARDAMPRGGRLTLETCNRILDEDYCSINAGATAGEYVELAVSDSGTGIPPEQLDQVFEPFFTTKPYGKGTGLGLAMAFGFVKRSGGYIKVDSEVGIGTTIHLYLPRAIGQVQKPVLNNEQPSKLPRGHGTVLVVDDEESLLKLAEISLRSLGYRVITANNADQALTCLKTEADVAMLVSDVVMPGSMNGYELAEQATRSHPGLKVLLTSGYTEKVVGADGQVRSKANLLRKPYTQTELAQQIQTIMGDNQPGQSSGAELKPDLSSIIWSEEFSTGIEPMDEDHKALLAIFNH
ncbi:hypothetical protein Tel_15875 [Candidatus Tenderia electrophaga]|jgi:PAS domain S-box-containing protein|uniref:histidine kinase n=1 Tax=Candidatus Tenderia electrophaga TaxID=1748243 RepID=A0A0S2THG9_9GAMM|nr:hypothetical protein Tel_15875 [Candidatus Tenderia electrophaga]